MRVPLRLSKKKGAGGMAFVGLVVILVAAGYGLVRLVKNRLILRRVSIFFGLLAAGLLAGTGLGQLVEPKPEDFGFVNIVAFWLPMVLAGFCAGMSTGPAPRPRRRFCVGVPVAMGVFIGAEVTSRIVWDPILLVVLFGLFLGAFFTGMIYRETEAAGATVNEDEPVFATQDGRTLTGDARERVRS
jgi:hypothetical protein